MMTGLRSGSFGRQGWLRLARGLPQVAPTQAVRPPAAAAAAASHTVVDRSNHGGGGGGPVRPAPASSSPVGQHVWGGGPARGRASALGRPPTRGLRTSASARSGSFSDPLPLHIEYAAGTFFMHARLGYRGIVVMPWHPRVTEYHLQGEQQETLTDLTDAETTTMLANAKPAPLMTLKEAERNVFPSRTCAPTQILPSPGNIELTMAETSERTDETYYQVICDVGRQGALPAGDRQLYAQSNWCHHVPPVLKPQINGKQGLVSGVDYVSHSDMLPFTPDSLTTVDNILTDTLFVGVRGAGPKAASPTALAPRGLAYSNWINACDAGLKSGGVFVSHCAATGIEITIMPVLASHISPREVGTNGRAEGLIHYEHRSPEDHPVWAYKVLVHNHSGEPLTLMQRTWFLVDSEGAIFSALTGRGVVGMCPTLDDVTPTFQYSSFASLPTHTGKMGGHFTFAREDGSAVEVAVPTFELRGSARATLTL